MSLPEKTYIDLNLREVDSLLSAIEHVAEWNTFDPAIRDKLLRAKERLLINDPDNISKEDYNKMTPEELVAEIRRRENHPGMHHCYCMTAREWEGKVVVSRWIEEDEWHESKRIGEPVGYCGECSGTGWCY